MNEKQAASAVPGSVVASAQISLRIGQHVRHRDHLGKRVTGRVRGLTIEGDDDTLKAHFVLDEPIVIPAADGYAQFDIWHQTVPAHELTPFDERDEQVSEMLDALKAVVRQCGPKLGEVSGNTALLPHLETVIAKVTGSRP